MKNFFVQLGAVAIMLYTLTFGGSAYAQSCPGGFWGNGQCIAACEEPLVNPNIYLAFYGYQIQDTGTCEDGYAYAYPEYTAYDMAYGNLYCGIVIDWNDGGCYGMPPNLHQMAPRRRGDGPMPFYRHSSFSLTIDMRNPAAMRPMRQIQVHDRHFWWKHSKV